VIVPIDVVPGKTMFPVNVALFFGAKSVLSVDSRFVIFVPIVVRLELIETSAASSDVSLVF
jgi:hypothetical protein